MGFIYAVGASFATYLAVTQYASGATTAAAVFAAIAVFWFAAVVLHQTQRSR